MVQVEGAYNFSDILQSFVVVFAQTCHVVRMVGRANQNLIHNN